jgi:hypothetical protein
MFTKSGGLSGPTAASPPDVPSSTPTEGAALIPVDGPEGPAFFLFNEAGTKAVASFLKSRSCGAASIVADALVGPLGLDAAAVGGAPTTPGVPGLVGKDG